MKINESKQDIPPDPHGKIKKGYTISSSLARKNQLFAAVKPTLDRTLHVGTIVDLGCGLGDPAEFLSGYYDQYIGIDNNRDLVTAARTLHKNNSRAEFLVQDCSKLKLPPNSADLILAVGTFHHLEKLHQVMEGLVRIAKPHSPLVIVEPQPDSPVGLLYRTIRPYFDEYYTGGQRFYTEQYLRSLLKRYALTDLSVDYQGFLSPPFSQVFFSPQILCVPLSFISSTCDNIFQIYLPDYLKKFAANILITGYFPDTSV